MVDDYLDVDGFEWRYDSGRGWVLELPGGDLVVSYRPGRVVVTFGDDSFCMPGHESLEDVLRDVALWALGA